MSARDVVNMLSEPETAKKLQRLSDASKSIANTSRHLEETVSRLSREGNLAAAAGHLEFASVFIDSTITSSKSGERDERESVCQAATEVVKAIAAIMAELALLLHGLRARRDA